MIISQLEPRLPVGESEKVGVVLCVVFGSGGRSDHDKEIGYY